MWKRPYKSEKIKGDFLEYEIKRFGIKSVVKISTAFGALVGFTFGLLIGALISSMSRSMGLPPIQDPLFQSFFRIFFSRWSIIIYPIFYTVSGAVTGALYSWIYNLVAKKTGGVIFELTEFEETSAGVVPNTTIEAEST
ncbi:MAG: hypothetical protein AMQ22_01126 [Candidatus Methanofastidiosum methylothiophilum]|uniref:DUF3566 domain-containing protein n=1 Tax=Candidatus Methanofastidiosum methylothiophilum TaxID=1705564 RepID=A0A150J3R8_9EURY|nr:MAG: hypothetical protein AMQ22_01126 [Candidatus Methanofastidiosum methylthiophilus]